MKSNPNTTKITAKAVPHRQVHPPHPNPSSSDDATMQLRMRLAEASGQVQNTGWLVELMQSLASTDRFSTACHELTSQLQTHLGVVRVVLGWSGSRATQNVASISGTVHQDKHSEEVRLYQSCLDEAITRETIGVCPSPSQDNDSMLSHQQVAGRDREVVSTPLITKSQTTVGSLMVIASRGQLASNPRVIDFLSASSSPLADVLSACERAEGTRFTKAIRWFRSASVAKRTVNGACIAGVIAAAWIPVTYQVAAPSIIEPVQRRFCVAPHDGLLEQTKVEPGDVVEVNQPVASMDGREVRWELAGLIAQQRRAAKQHDAHLAAHKTTEAMQAELEMQRLQSQIDLLRHRESNLTLTAPIAGIVLSGSMDRRENFPVDQGQVLYEIAPLEELRIELSVSSDDVSHIAEGTNVEMMFAGFGNETFTATISKIRPQSEVRDDQNVFVAECLLANRDGRLRPGMKGHAKIQGDKHAIGWIALHRAWEQVCMRVPW
ncbi:efflux RND transporter periplasmic adaptor subunit [Rubripirellula amarantea]|uniref:HlyD family secretion protein n=1 Tax=Rubripirellula amarantea TaxID=2527999 RepID=A0A5C5WJE7_9BACT|nr:HlyD family efflux transporter periplasmic adaptor subunit [Rubripirellula amarantea]MDA8743928.1 efflux RND transporter periplasmic adaptor subunit [Rubripirellula amarantea]TWT50245.1 HlyD family secretion protein [Rubripirellula amarantea]